MANEQRRERVPFHLRGKAWIAGEPKQTFPIEIIDYSVSGMQLWVPDYMPDQGAVIEMVVEYRTAGGLGSIPLSGELIRVNAKEGSALCGLRLDQNNTAENLAALDQYYIERFFDEEL